MKKYGLIGYPLGHSFSQQYFTEKFKRERIEGCAYSAFPIPDISGLGTLLDDDSLCGLNVTIPYKEQVIAWLDEQDEVVRQIGACNCIKIDRAADLPGHRRVRGYNTDVTGFEQSLVGRLRPHHDHALILGTGGAAKAVEYVLLRLGIAYRHVSRSAPPDSSEAGDGRPLSYRQLDEALLGRYTLIINTTPVGMHPNIDECPPLPYEAITSRHYLFDLVYNPAKTLFLQKGEARGATTENGYDMLVIQAEESWKIWNA
ncbi:MAG: shikimate dehydrogenase [Bacteroidota bacterium]|nr:shikimate dehydrogenase [Bacteroidota bacterium]MDP4215255.1 shikimate dehydrogenase [Bacteroidota bacterium]MDP4248337.1 shikimate dehydrogenase [Bacteroidota bacterium]MDP4253509.1 shikimate dehydrogenase [Bacteroidota bacterium]MDP4258103.1 shikimate dehydrogenase [Bacteroidota bacterium]